MGLPSAVASLEKTCFDGAHLAAFRSGGTLTVVGFGSPVQFVAAGCFILVIPLAVIGGLDELKKGNDRANRGAREATRYIETVSFTAQTGTI